MKRGFASIGIGFLPLLTAGLAELLKGAKVTSTGYKPGTVDDKVSRGISHWFTTNAAAMMAVCAMFVAIVCVIIIIVLMASAKTKRPAAILGGLAGIALSAWGGLVALHIFQALS